MSVVNKMLQDLEARQTSSNAISADYVPPPRSQRKIWYVLLFIILVFGVAAYLWFMQGQWTHDKLLSFGFIDAKMQQKQTNTGSKRSDASKKLNRNAVTNESLVVTPATLETNQPPQQTNNEQALVATGSVAETSPIPSAIESTTTNSSGAATNQQAIETDIHQTPPESDNLLENVIENGKKKEVAAESSFSISGSSEKDKAVGAKQSVINALSDGDNDLAISRLEELLKMEPDNLDARKKLAALLFAQQRNNQAEHVLRQGMTRHPQRHDLRLMLARLYIQNNNPDAALKVLNEVPPDTTNQFELLAYRAALLQQNGHNELAKSDYLQLLAIDSLDAKWWLGLAITQDRLGQSSEALSAYRKANNKEQLSPSVVKFVQQRMIQLEGTK